MPIKHFRVSVIIKISWLNKVVNLSLFSNKCTNQFNTLHQHKSSFSQEICQIIKKILEAL